MKASPGPLLCQKLQAHFLRQLETSGSIDGLAGI
jgi:hypothetical protein